MRVLQLNAYGNFSTGKISQGIALECNEHGVENLFLYGRNKCDNPNINSLKISSSLSCKFHFLMSRIFDRSGFYSNNSTNRIIREIIKFAPDIIQLHIVHGYYCNIKKLFRFLKKYGKPVVWTFHDCWSYTGHCAYYLSANCYKWKTGCAGCTEKMTYPRSFVFSQSRRNYKEKKAIFGALDKLTIVANCNWLAREVSDSFLGKNRIVTIHNGVDQNVFKYNDLARKKIYGNSEKYIVLSVANKWDIRKGLNDVIDVYKKLNPNKFLFVIVGLTLEDQNLYNYKIPEQFVVINRTSNQKELADYYSSSDCFLCLSHEDTFPTTIIESISCGTPVLTYDVGGCSEAIVNNLTGRVFSENDIESISSLLAALPKFNREACVEASKAFNSNESYRKYIELYSELVKNYGKRC